MGVSQFPLFIRQVTLGCYPKIQGQKISEPLETLQNVWHSCLLAILRVTNPRASYICQATHFFCPLKLSVKTTAFCVCNQVEDLHVYTLVL